MIEHVKRCLILAALFCCAVPCFAQDSTLKLPAEIYGETGEFVSVKADTAGKVVRWVPLTPGLNLFPVELLKDSKTMVVSSLRAGEYRLLAYTSKADVPSEPAFVVVKIGVSPPSPVPPGPTPPGPVPPIPTPPAPNIPDGSFGLTKFAYAETMKLPPASRANASGVATNLEAVASAASAGTIPTVEAMHKLAKEKNRVTLANDLVAWAPWSVAFQAKMQALFNSGHVTSVEQTAEAMRSAAAGLRAVK